MEHWAADIGAGHPGFHLRATTATNRYSRPFHRHAGGVSFGAPREAEGRTLLIRVVSVCIKVHS